MNQLSYLVDDTKIKKIGIKLKSKIDVDIKQTLSLLSENKNDL